MAKVDQVLTLLLAHGVTLKATLAAGAGGKLKIVKLSDEAAVGEIGSGQLVWRELLTKAGITGATTDSGPKPFSLDPDPRSCLITLHPGQGARGKPWLEIALQE